mgnify:FL=1
MSKPFMFHFTAKLYTIFYSRNFFRNFFLKKAKKFRHESKNFRFYVIKHIFIAQEQKNSESGKTFGVNL